MSEWNHLPNAVHIDYVIEQTKKIVAWGAARGAAWNAAWGTARDAAWDAAWNAARDVARDAARSAAWGTARDAAWNAARGAARDVAWDVAWDAARDAAWNAAWDAARGAARDVALALVAWDDCGHWVYTDPEIIKAHIAMTDDFAARLIYPFALLNHELLKA